MFVLRGRCALHGRPTGRGAAPTSAATAHDVVYLYDRKRVLPARATLSGDVIASWAACDPAGNTGDVAPSAASREHRLVESASGLLTIAGGKLTTYRVMGRDVVDRVAARLRELDGRPRPPACPRTGYASGRRDRRLEGLVKAAMQRGIGRVARHLVAGYGSDQPAVLNIVDRDRALGRPMSPGVRHCGRSGARGGARDGGPPVGPCWYAAPSVLCDQRPRAAAASAVAAAGRGVAGRDAPCGRGVAYQELVDDRVPSPRKGLAHPLSSGCNRASTRNFSNTGTPCVPAELGEQLAQPPARDVEPEGLGEVLLGVRRGYAVTKFGACGHASALEVDPLRVGDADAFRTSRKPPEPPGPGERPVV